MAELIIYVRDNCMESGKAFDIASLVRRLTTDVDLKIVNLDRSAKSTDGGESEPQSSFQGPIYVLDGKVIQLGNPDPEELLIFLKSFQKKHQN